MACVLIVDDSLVMRKGLQGILAQGGYTVVGEACNGQEAIQMYAETKPDFVTMDINMPVMSGIEAVERLVSLYPKVRIIMISSLDERDTVLEALKKGAKYYILKPVTYEKVLDALDKVAKRA